MQDPKKPHAFFAVSVLILLVATVALPWLSWLPDGHRAILVFLLVLAGNLFMFMAFGMQITGAPFGIFLSGRNTYSLSRLQMASWTWLVLSALIAVAALRLWTKSGGAIAIQATDALNIYIPQNLFVVLGISFFTGAAAPTLLSLKAQTTPAKAQVDAASQRMGEAVEATGQIVTRPTRERAHFGDIVQGDDLATAGTVDISKVQHLLITVLLLGVYAAMLVYLFSGYQLAEGVFFLPSEAAKALAQGGKIPAQYWTALPEFPSTMLTLLAVSHGGYLVYKAAPRAATGGQATEARAGGAQTDLDPAKAVG
jgi:hypothetical protein